MPVPAGGIGAASPDLFSDQDLTDFLRQGQLDAASVAVARRVVGGWLQNATGLTAWPDPVPDDLFGWAVELGAFAYNNPESLASDAVGGTATTWDRARRAEILDAARAAYNTGGRSGGPVFSFPAPDWEWR